MIQKYFPSKKNPSIEMYRLLGSLIVIGIHSINSLPNIENFKGTKKFWTCIFADGVAIFWFILGFHLFKNNGYYILLKKVIKRLHIKYFALGFTLMFSKNYFSKKPPFPTTKDFTEIY